MKKVLLFFSLILAMQFYVYAQVNYKIHSLFLYKFTQFIQWPSAGGEFVIGVVGNSPISTELDALAASKKVGDRAIVVKKLTASSADMASCNLLFVAESSSSSLGSIASKVAGKPILIISETGGGAKKGSGINFLLVEDKLRFELNKGEIEKRGLKVSSDLLKLAIVVD